MAKIPMGNFGQAQARSAPPASIPRGDPIGAAVDRVGQVGGAIASDMERQRLQERAAGLQEIDRQQRQQDAEAKQARTEAERAQALVTMNGAKDRLTDLHDEVKQGVLDGTVPKDKAEATFQERASKLLGEAGPGLPDRHREIGLAELSGASARLSNSVRQAVTLRDKQDVTGGITQTLEYLQRQYKIDPAKATEQAMATVDGLGPHSTMTPDQLAKLKQGWREGTQFTTAYEMVSAGRNDRRALDAAEAAIGRLPDLDPQKRAVLGDRVAAYRLALDQRAEMASARAARESEARLKRAEAEFNTFQAMADKGTVLDPAYIDRAITATTGTPYQAGVRQLAQAARDNGGLASQPVPAQRATLTQIDALIAQQGRTPELDKRREQVEKVLQGSESDLGKDALRAGLQRGVITDLPPLQMTGGMQALAQQLGARSQQAQLVERWAGRAVSPVTAEEAQQLGGMLRTLGPQERGAGVAMLAQSMPPRQAQALAKQIDAQDKPLALALAVGAQRTTQGRTTAELILRGAQVAKDKGVKEEVGAEFGLRAQLAKAVGDAVPAAARDDVLAASRFIYLAKQSEGDGISYEGAVRLAIGGDIVEHAGRRLPVPAGVNLPDRLQRYPRSAIEAQAPDATVYTGQGRPMGVPEFLSALPSAQLEPVGMGRYAVRSGGSLVTNASRQPIIIEVAP